MTTPEWIAHGHLHRTAPAHRLELRPLHEGEGPVNTPPVRAADIAIPALAAVLHMTEDEVRERLEEARKREVAV